MNDQIKFGTDGWRGVIAEDYTFENVRRVAGAIAAYVLKNEDHARGLVIGYDTRFGSRRFAQAAAEVLAAAGIPIPLKRKLPVTHGLSADCDGLPFSGMCRRLLAGGLRDCRAILIPYPLFLRPILPLPDHAASLRSRPDAHCRSIDYVRVGQPVSDRFASSEPFVVVFVR